LKFDESKRQFDMELKELRIIFENGGLKAVTIKSDPLTQGYIIIAESANKEVHVMTSQRESSNVPRTFKSIDAAAANAQKIGFKRIKLDLSQPKCYM